MLLIYIYDRYRVAGIRGSGNDDGDILSGGGIYIVVGGSLDSRLVTR